MDPLLNIIGTSENTFQFTKDYTMILSFFSVFLILQIALSGMVRSEGETAKAMLGMIIGSGINIVLDPIFISVLNMGIGGAAWATVIGNFCGVLYYLIYYLRKKSILSISPVWFKPTKKIFKEVSKIGVPASLGQLIMGISFILVNVVASSYGDYIVAGNGVQMRVVSIATLIIMGISQGYQPFAGYNYGAKNSERLIKSFKITMLYNTVLSVLFTVLFALFSKDVIKIFINDPQVIDAGAKNIESIFMWASILRNPINTYDDFSGYGKSIKSNVYQFGKTVYFLHSFAVHFKCSFWIQWFYICTTDRRYYNYIYCDYVFFFFCERNKNYVDFCRFYKTHKTRCLVIYDFIRCFFEIKNFYE